MEKVINLKGGYNEKNTKYYIYYNCNSECYLYRSDVYLGGSYLWTVTNNSNCTISFKTLYSCI